jgi:hypothetical protein
MGARFHNNVRQIRQLTDGMVQYSVPRALLLESALLEPTCFSNHVKVSEWRNAMQVEFNPLLKNHTWSFVTSMAVKNVVGCKWVFKQRERLMDLSNVTRQGWLLRDFTNMRV